MGGEVSDNIVERAVKIGRYLIPHAQAAFAEMGTDPTVEEAKHVLRWIERKGVDTFTKREAFEGTKGRFRRVTALEPALDLLLAQGYIREAESPERKGPGRKPSARYEVSPFLKSDTSE